MDREKLPPPVDRARLAPMLQSSGVDSWESRSRLFSSTSMSLFRRPVEQQRIPSPYEVAQANRHYKKVYPNRVYTPWYRRYVNKLPDVESIDFQPFDEVQKIDEDIAMQYFYGEDGHLSDPMVDRQANDKRKTALQRYRRVKEQEEREKANAAADNEKFGAKAKLKRFADTGKQMISSMETEFGATAVEKKVYSPIVDFLQKLHTIKQRMLRKVRLKPRSKWRVVKSPAVILKLRQMYKRLLQDQIHARFRKVIKLVAAVIRFIETIRFISGDTKKILREIENFLTSQTRDTNKSFVHGMKKKLFDPHKYNISKELHIPFETKLTLTKPWFTRQDDEIDMVVEALQSYKSFVQYPPLFQRRLATLAWYIEAGADKYIIRERHIACDFYVLLTGKAKVVKMRGSPYIYHNGELSFIRYIKKSEGFGDESMSDPECEREYSVISTEPCALLSISVHDYLQMLSTRKEDEFAPEHIIFLCNLKLMDNFPKVKLLEEGHENITIHYFRPETVVSRNLEDSNFVFVVFSGSCQLLAEVFPEVLATPRKEQFTNRLRRRSTMRRQTIKVEPSFMKLIGNKWKASVSQPHNMWIKQQIDSQKKTLEPMFAATKSSVKEYVDKAQQILRTLPKQQRDAVFATGCPQLYVSTHIGQRKRDSLTTKDEGSQPLTAAFNSYYDNMASATGLAGVVENIRTSAQDLSPQNFREAMKVKMNSAINSVTEITEAPARDDDVAAKESTASCSENEDSCSMRAFDQSKDESKRKTAGPEKRPHVLADDPTKEKRSHLFLYSQWKHIRTLSRGDYTGHEWLDYRDGPFEPPEDVMSLISHGCEMVMVKKSFLVRYLRREW